MKDQGKISELNQSSHCNQSRNTEGRMSETYAPQSFLGLSIKSGPSKVLASPATPPMRNADNTGLQRTTARKLRRVKAKQRRDAIIIANLPQDASFQDRFNALNPAVAKQEQDKRERRIAKLNRHQCYIASLQAANRTLPKDLMIRSSKESHQTFCGHYNNQTISEWQPPTTLVRDLKQHATPTDPWMNNRHMGDLPPPAVNFSHFPKANVPAILGYGRSCPPQLGMPDYEPQSGSLETCANLLETYESVVASPLYGRVISLLTWENPILSTAALLATCLALLLLKTCVMTVNFLLGVITGVIFINKPPSYRYSPQAGNLDSQDGRAFTGKKPSPPKDKPSSVAPPGITHYNYGGASFGSTGVPKKPAAPVRKPEPKFMGGFATGF